MIDTILFDLDNTLYQESMFVRSGLRSVAYRAGAFIEAEPESIFDFLIDVLVREGRGEIFNRLLEKYDCFTNERLQVLIYEYRTHIPTIALAPDVKKLLSQLLDRGIKLGLITDGMAAVQRRKIRALEIDGYFQSIICTDELGKAYWKPSVVPFQIAMNHLAADPLQTVYVGDDLSKDFGGPLQLNMKGFWLNTQPEFSYTSSKGIEMNQEKITQIGSVLDLANYLD